MATNEEFAKYLVKTNPQNSAARLAFYNFVKNFSNLTKEFDSETIDQFFRSCLTHDHWRKEKKELAHEVTNCVERFNELHGLEIEIVQPVDKMQIVSIENKKDQKEVIQNFLGRLALDKTTTFIESENQIFLIQALPQQKIKVHIFDNLFLIVGGNLEPLCYDQSVIYDSKLDIEKEVTHQIRVMPQILAQFKSGQHHIEVSYIQGPFFKKFKNHAIEKLIEDKQLYFNLKKLERHFIDPTSDPVYVDVISKLEEALYLLEAHGERANDHALKALEIGENFYTHAFPDDKMLGQLLNDIRHFIKSQGRKGAGTQWNPSASINLSPKMEL